MKVPPGKCSQPNNRKQRNDLARLNTNQYPAGFKKPHPIQPFIGNQQLALLK